MKHYLEDTKALYQQNIRNKQSNTEQAAGKIFEYFMGLLVDRFKDNIYCTDKSVYLYLLRETYEAVEVNRSYIDKPYLVELIKGKFRAAGYTVAFTSNQEFVVSGWAEDNQEN